MAVAADEASSAVTSDDTDVPAGTRSAPATGVVPLRVTSSIVTVVSSSPGLVTRTLRRPGPAGRPPTTTWPAGGPDSGTHSAPRGTRPSKRACRRALATRPRCARTCTASSARSGARVSSGMVTRLRAGTGTPRPARASAGPWEVKTATSTTASAASGLTSSSWLASPTMVVPPTNHDSERAAAQRWPA